ncbi:sialate O-acetylesterase [Pontibacter ummariensis]|uniref:Sialate O-acetylesterase n=1 Tax=Pontibacter ummariensis TaxID=1610492 RepID=A0A239IBB7_9BACT|nr:sialate O-acetylesterase [Pontibacter ummariensis]PRY09947.1 sialate O-acetylesterase [Pontibacter ummariensis]SNS90851.1 sialate O-acetylesterase [Pontibacter ummariensis]
MKKALITIQFVIALSLSIVNAASAVTLPAIFSDHMVLQQNAEVIIWGSAKAGEEVTVTGSWDNKSVTTKANNLAKWSVKLNTPPAGGPYTVTVKGYNTIVINDVLTGEVWLASGQSNMEWSAAAGIENAEQEIPKANYPAIRFFSVVHQTADGPQLDVKGEWVVSTPETMKHFSAVAYFFGRELHQELGVPVGLINSSWGGTPGEVWVSPETIAKDPVLKEAAATQEEVQWGPVQPGKAYHAMIAPLIPYRIAGALWYQGESNTNAPEAYATLLPALIHNWRSEWGYEFPFYFVQIAPYKDYGPQAGAILRDAQRRSLKVPNTGMVVVSDIGNNDDIHPRNKIDVGKRLANLTLHKTYGKTERPASGPLYREMKVEGRKVRLFFDYADQGLVSKGKELTNFQIAGEDRQFVDAKAKIEGNTVVVQAKSVKNPTAVRFEWRNAVEPSLFNKAGLPASSFRTDNWPITQEQAEAKK